MKEALAFAKDNITESDNKISTEAETEAPREPVKDKLGRSYGTGRRKSSTARVWIKAGSGKLIVNKREGDAYFKRQVLLMLLSQPFEATDTLNKFDIYCTVKGGGLSGQAGAVRHGISRALALFDPTLRKTLRRGGYLTRDSRRVERKKYGQPKARKNFQFSKR